MLLNSYTKPAKENGFTLIELLIVIVIIGILAAVAVPSFLGVRHAAEQSSVKSDVKNTQTAVVTALTKNPYATGFVKTLPGDTILSAFISPLSSGLHETNVSIPAGEVAVSVVQSKDNTIKITGDATNYEILGCNVNLPDWGWKYSSVTGHASATTGCSVAAPGGGEGTSPSPTPSPSTSTPSIPAPTPGMTLVWDLSLDSSCKTIKIPLAGTVDATINWGDNTGDQNVTSAKPTHSYSAGDASTRTINISGTFTEFNSSNSYDALPCLTEVSKWNNTGTIKAAYAFYADEHISKVQEIPSTVTTVASMFQSTSFNGDISNWDTSNVKDMSQMFYLNNEFNKPLNSWDTSKVTNFSNMFASSPAFNQSLNDWDTSSATTMQGMFAKAAAFNGNISSWDVSNVTNMQGTFNGATVFNQPIGSWNTSKVTTMDSMFPAAKAFNQPIGSWNTGKVTNMNNMFNGATLFNQNISNWDVNQVTTYSAFRNLSGLSLANTPTKFRS